MGSTFVKLEIAIKHGKNKKAMEIIQNKGSRTVTDALCLAIEFDNPTIIDCVIDNGSVNIQEIFYRNRLTTPLILATIHNDRDTVEKLLYRGANACIFDGNGNTPLHHAISKQYTDIIDLLLDEPEHMVKKMLKQENYKREYPLSLAHSNTLKSLALSKYISVYIRIKGNDLIVIRNKKLVADILTLKPSIHIISKDRVCFFSDNIKLKNMITDIENSQDIVEKNYCSKLSL